jgi:hypothetical protein
MAEMYKCRRCRIVPNALGLHSILSDAIGFGGWKSISVFQAVRSGRGTREEDNDCQNFCPTTLSHLSAAISTTDGPVSATRTDY